MLLIRWLLVYLGNYQRGFLYNNAFNSLKKNFSLDEKLKGYKKLLKCASNEISLLITSSNSSSNSFFFSAEKFFVKKGVNSCSIKWVICSFYLKLNLKCKTTKNNIISSYKEDYFSDRKIREDRVLDDLDRIFQN